MSTTPIVAHTVAGYWDLLSVPILGLFGFFGRRFIQKQDDLIEANKVQSQALAVLIAQVAPVQVATAKNTDDISELKQATAVLQSEVSKHDAWAAREHERLLGVIERA